jgi:glycosyltransferase involved in cell wall biosynthesis
VKPSLGVVLPVRNAQTRLESQIAGLLDVLPELANRFEIVIVDDCSHDQTEEIACELSMRFPQVRLIRHPWYRGIDTAIETGLIECDAETVVLCDDGAPLAAAELRRMWMERCAPQSPSMPADAAKHSRRPALAESASAASAAWAKPGLINRLIAWGTGLQPDEEKPRAGMCYLRRPAPPIAPGFAPRGARGRMFHEEAAAAGDAAIRPAIQKPPERADHRADDPPSPRAPNYLRPLKDFALGE